MPDDRLQDLRALDRDVARAFRALGGWRADLARDPGAHAGEDPLEPVRRVAGKSTWDGLGQLKTSVADEPVRDALRRWVYAFLQARVGQPDEIAWAQAAADERGRYEGERPRRVAWREAWRGVARAPSATEGRLWLNAAAECAPAIAEAARSRAARRTEVARRLGLGHPWEPSVGVAASVLRATAARLLDRTEDVARAAYKDAFSSDAGPAATFHAAMARDASEGWPAHLVPRWLDELFGAGVRGLPLRLPPLPEAVGGASFGRALASFGFALRVAAAPATFPFALSRDPSFGAAHAFAFVFGSLVADPEFHARALGLARSGARAQARSLATTALFDARLHAVRLLLGDDEAPAPRDLFDELTARLFGSPLDARLRGAWPDARHDETARWTALLRTPDVRDTLRDLFDVDWFRNPRVWPYLRALGAEPAYVPADEKTLDASVDVTARAFEDALA